MRQITLRIDKEIIKTINLYSESFGYRPSTLIRDFIEAGISTKIKFNTYLKMQLNFKIPIDEINLGSDQARIAFYLEPTLLDDARLVFLEDDQAVLRRVLRLGLFRLNNTNSTSNQIEIYVPNYQIIIELNKEKPPETHYKDLQDYDAVVDKHKQNMRALQYVSTTVATDKIQQYIQRVIVPFLNESSKKQILIVTGPRGSGKTHLIEYILSIAEFKKLSQIIENQDLRRDLDSFAGGYTPIRLIDDSGELEQVIRRLEEHEPPGDQRYAAMINPNEKLRYLLERHRKENPEKQLIFYLEIETPERVAKNMETMKSLSQYSLRTIVETNNPSVIKEILGQLPSTEIIKLE